jgi:hypothetical protein
MIFEMLIQTRIAWDAPRLGEIYGTEVTDETLVATAIAFEHTRLHGVSLKLGDARR